MFSYSRHFTNGPQTTGLHHEETLKLSLLIPLKMDVLVRLEAKQAADQVFYKLTSDGRAHEGLERTELTEGLS